MPNSRVASVIGVISQYVDGVGGISPVPVPPRITLPYITVHEILTRELQNLTGRSGLAQTLMQVNCWAKTYEAAYALRDQVKDSFLLDSRGLGPVQSNTLSSGQRIEGVNHDRDFELYDANRELHQLIVRFSIWFGDTGTVSFSVKPDSPRRNPDRDSPIPNMEEDDE